MNANKRGETNCINMADSRLEQDLASAFRTARIRVKAAVRAHAVLPADRDDLTQDLLIACWLAIGKFDPKRACLRTFLGCVVSSHLASAIRTSRRRPEMLPLDLASERDSGEEVGRLELRLDVARILSQLESEDRRFAAALTQLSATETSRELGVARSTTYGHLGHLRAAFNAAGFGTKRGGRCDRRDEMRS